MHSQVIQLYMYLFFSISYLFTSLGFFFFSFAGQKLFSWISSLLSIFALLSVLCLHSQLLFGKVVKNIQWRKDSLFNKSSWEHWISTCKRIKSHLFLQHAQVSTQDRYRPEHKTWNCKTPRRKHRGNFMTWIWQWLYEHHIKSQTNGCELGVPHQFFYMDAKHSSSTCLRDHPSHCSAEPPQTYMRSPLCVSLCWSIGQFLCPWVNTTWLIMISWYSQCLVENCVLSKLMSSVGSGYFYDNIILGEFSPERQGGIWLEFHKLVQGKWHPCNIENSSPQTWNFFPLIVFFNCSVTTLYSFSLHC